MNLIANGKTAIVSISRMGKGKNNIWVTYYNTEVEGCPQICACQPATITSSIKKAVKAINAYLGVEATYGTDYDIYANKAIGTPLNPKNPNFEIAREGNWKF